MLFSSSEKLYAQAVGSSITYEEIYDAPYEVNKLFVHFQPMYADMHVSNVTAGLGMEVNYYLADKFDFRAHARTAYARVTDFERNIASQIPEQQNRPNVYNYFEVGATYHIKDYEDDTESKVTLYSTRFKGGKWASRVPDHIMVPSKVRKIMGARLGAFSFNSSTNLVRAIEAQGQEIVLQNDAGQALPEGQSVSGNVQVHGLYLGASMTWIKNFAIKPDKGYGTLVNDLIFNTYFDIMIAPSVNIDDVYFGNMAYSTEEIKTNIMGVRAGI